MEASKDFSGCCLEWRESYKGSLDKLRLFSLKYQGLRDIIVGVYKILRDSNRVVRIFTRMEMSNLEKPDTRLL